MDDVMALVNKINSVDLNRAKYIEQLQNWRNDPACFSDESAKRFCERFLAEWIEPAG